ncbi:MAG TPA: dihydrodipicolinate synthase family protein [Candidatus Binatia bacterium]
MNSSKSKYDGLRVRLCGPIYPIPVAFKEDFSLDCDGVARYVEFLNSHNVRSVMVTAGTSRLNLLTEDEVRRLNEVVVEANGGRAVSIAANPMTGGVGKAVEFAKHAEAIGADAILLYYPERYYNDGRVFDYFRQVASSVKIGVLLHGIPMRNAHAGEAPTKQYSVSLCERLAALDNMVGMKEESGDEGHRYKLATHLRGKMSLIVAGASMRMFLGCVLLGVESYLVGVGSFKPEIEEQFYQAVRDGRYARALGFVTEFEEPFFDVAFPMGWHIAMKGAMELLGLMSSVERPPLGPPDAEQRKALADVMTRLGWLQPGRGN